MSAAEDDAAAAVDRLSAKEQAALDQFRISTADLSIPSREDWKFDTKEARKMLVEHIAWRKKNEVDSILEDYQPPQEELKRNLTLQNGGRRIETMHVVADMEGFSFWQLSSLEVVSTLTDVVRMYEDNFPEIPGAGLPRKCTQPISPSVEHHQAAADSENHEQSAHIWKK
ncbi:hypothetical protein MTO96_018657 [Rhipicephalus appendiculatus]